jgi:NADPH-dependent curcumin reductase CurA
MTDGPNRQILLVEKPSGKLAPTHFKMVEGKIPEPKDGEVLLRVRYISLDAANRAWMHGATYRSAVEANTVMAGGAEKCHWLTSTLGFDAAVDYKDGATYKALKAAAPKGIDVYFDNVGGDILEACISQMNLHGRIACCGAISQYDGVPSATGPRGVPGLIVVNRLLMQGFIVMDYMDQRDQALADLQSWVAAGKLKVQEDVIAGIENTPQALIGLLAGENRGKRMIKV